MALAALLLPATLAAQRRSFEAFYGRWLNGNDAASYELRSNTPPFAAGTLTHGFGVTVLVHDSLGRHRAFYGFGYELQAFRYRSTLGPYAVIGVELGLSTDTSRQELGALWSAGAGLEWRPPAVSRFAVATEARWRLEDRGPRGFWRPGAAHRGLAIALGASLGLGRGGGGGRTGRGRGSRRLSSSRRPPRSPAARRMWFEPR